MKGSSFMLFALGPLFQVRVAIVILITQLSERHRCDWPPLRDENSDYRSLDRRTRTNLI
jgi:hypothetical protein